MSIINDKFQINSVDYPVSFDLQSHTFFSDGRNSPTELVNSAVAQKINIISITDHNSINAYTKDTFDTAIQHQITLIPGCEIECGGGLDILVYDNSQNNLSDDYQEKITNLTVGLNEARNKYVLESIDKVKAFLKGSENISWMNWQGKSEDEKNKILSYLSLGNASRVDLRTGKLLDIKRDYVSKPHLGMLLAPFNLINLEKFAAEFNIPIEKAPKYALGFIFDKAVPWPLDKLPINEEILTSVIGLPFVKVMAHPGKTFEDQFNENEITEDKFKEFLLTYLKRGLNGAEADYRRYKNPKLDYNQLTKQILNEYQQSSNQSVYATGGSDTHDLFE